MEWIFFALGSLFLFLGGRMTNDFAYVYPDDKTLVALLTVVCFIFGFGFYVLAILT